MRGDAGDGHLGPHEAAVGRADGELRRLPDDGSVDGRSGQMPKHLLDAEAGVLLVGDGCHHDLPGKSSGRCVPAGDERRGYPGLHVVGAAGVQPVSFDPRDQRFAHPRVPDGVEVPAQQQPAAALAAAAADKDAGSAGGRFENLDPEPGGLGPAGDEGRELGLAGPVPGQPGVGGVDPDYRLQELDHAVSGVHVAHGCVRGSHELSPSVRPRRVAW